MQSRDHVAALEFWAAQSKEQRQKILKALEADESAADHDFAALPPQVRAGVAAGLTPAEPPPGDADEGEGEPDEHGQRAPRKKR